MRYLKLIAVFAVLSIAATSNSCSSGITIVNKTNIGVRVAVFPPIGGMQVVSPGPGENAVIDSNDAGSFTAVVIPSQQWIAWAKDRRITISSLLANPQSMSPEAVRDLIVKLQEINSQIQQYEQATGKGNSCSGNLEPDQAIVSVDFYGLEIPWTIIKGAFVDVTMDSTGNLAAKCR